MERAGRESVAAPAVAAGTLSSTLTSRLSCGRTVTCVSRRTTECGLPASSCVETVKVAGASPKFLRVTVSRPAKSRSSSAKPKFSAGASLSPSATTWVWTAGSAWTRPVPAPAVT